MDSKQQAKEFINGQYSNYKTSEDLPRITLTFAQSLDGKIASHDKQPILLSGEHSMFMTQYLRCENDGIMVGIGTVLSDNPRLTVRNPMLLGMGYNQPQPIVVDSKLEIPLECNLMKNLVLPIVICSEDSLVLKKGKAESLKNKGVKLLPIPLKQSHIDLYQAFQQLKKLNINSIMVEGGVKLITSLLKENNLLSHIIITIAPIILGINGIAFTEYQTSLPFHSINYCKLGNDVVMACKLYLE